MIELGKKSFIAVLACKSAKGINEIDYVSSFDPAVGGWLVVGRQNDSSLELRFDLIEQVDGRHHCTITGAPSAGKYAGSSLGVSRNGYVGFYQVSAGADFWKLELLESSNAQPDYFEFTLRDTRGYRVAVSSARRGSFWTGIDPYSSQSLDFLNVEHGDIGRFAAQKIRFV